MAASSLSPPGPRFDSPKPQTGRQANAARAARQKCGTREVGRACGAARRSACRLLRLRRGAAQRVPPIWHPPDRLKSWLAYSPGVASQVHFWDTASLEMLKTLDCPIVNPTLGGNTKVKDITSASLSPDRKRFIAGGPADQVRACHGASSPAKPRAGRRPRDSPERCCSRVCVRAQAWPDPWVHVFDFETGKEIECLKGHHGHVWDVAFGARPAAPLLASFSPLSSNVSAGDSPARPFAWCRGAKQVQVLGLALRVEWRARRSAAPDGETYASGADDGTIRIWQTDPGGAKSKADAAAE